MKQEPILVAEGKYIVACSGNGGEHNLWSVYLYENGKLIQHQTWGKAPTEEDLRQFIKSYQALNPVILKFVSDDKKYKECFVESISFHNSWYQGFKNTSIGITDNIDYALRIYKRDLADQLKGFAESATNIKVEIVEL